MARVDGGKERFMRAGERYADPGLDDPVSPSDAPDVRIVLRAVEWMRYGADQ